ncbi:MAG: hypothetical protein JWR38_178 [Mucilaginibacter sp.]|nr:hypothetical protein [Mucilaginibacter sp.]
MTIENFHIVHLANIIIHVVAGSAALLTGIMALIAKKGLKLHIKSGKVFLALLTIVILTGLLGVFIFGRNTFLLVITVLSGYFGYSGYRTLQTKSNKPKLIDIGIALLSLLSVLYFLYYFKSIGMIWAPVIIYTTVGYLIFIIMYDFARYFIPASVYSHLWLYEHILKMTGAFSALLSAFTGTVFPQYKPYSQFLPSVFGTLIAIGFMIYTYRKNKRTELPV